MDKKHYYLKQLKCKLPMFHAVGHDSLENKNQKVNIMHTF